MNVYDPNKRHRGLSDELCGKREPIAPEWAHRQAAEARLTFWQKVAAVLFAVAFFLALGFGATIFGGVR